MTGLIEEQQWEILLSDRAFVIIILIDELPKIGQTELFEI
jgi:hypothetical protein